jgi:hypothetical protein
VFESSEWVNEQWEKVVPEYEQVCESSEWARRAVIERRGESWEKENILVIWRGN